MEKDPLRILVLLDKKPGHAHQAEGMAEALKLLAPVEAKRLPIRPGRLANHRLMAMLAKNKQLDPMNLLRFFYSIHIRKEEKIDLIITSGRLTFAPGILLKKIYQCPLIYSGRYSFFLAQSTDLQLVPSPRYAFYPKAAFAPVPCKIARGQFPPPPSLTTSHDLRGASLSLLLGGKASGYRYRREDWATIARLVAISKERFGIKWTVATSRRSPEGLAALFSAHAEVIDFKSADPGGINHLYGADAIVVSEDSLSMIGEGLASGRKVIALRPEEAGDGYAGEVIATMAARGGLAVMPIAGLDLDRFCQALLRLAPPTHDPHQEIARVLGTFLGLEP